jgi:tryptophan-rich sensory protein
MFGTIQLMGPMILAKRILTTVGYIFYDHYNGRYLRTTYTRRMQHMQEFEVIASARALGRFLLQCWTMMGTGGVIQWVMNRAPSCMLQPAWVCHWWYGMVWMGVVYMAGWGMGVAVKNEGYTINMGRNDEDGTAITKYYGNPLSIRPTYISTSTNPLRRRQQQSHGSPMDRLLRIPRQVLQWMREPEESINNVFRFANQKSNHPIRPATPAKRSLDTLLFPSTWRPLRLWSCLTIVYAISITLTSGNTAALHRVMKSFIVQETFHYEWYRVFVKERRIALGAVICMVGLVALLRMNVMVASIDKLAGLALIPMLIAEVVTWYMNTILYFDHYLPSARPPSPVKRDGNVVGSLMKT